MIDNNVICETSRMILRKIVDEDVDSLLPILGNAEVMRFSVHGPDNRDGVLKFVDATKKRYARDGDAQWAVILKSSGAFIGECGISIQVIDGSKEYEIGYRFNPLYWRQGFASEAAIACRDYGFEKLKLERLISIIEKENEASIGVAKKVGMRLEKESAFHGIPVEIYSLDRCRKQLKRDNYEK